MRIFSSLTASWRTRTALFFALMLALGHAFALWGLKIGMPEAPIGDESRFLRLMAIEAMRIVWLPWETPGADAAAPAGLARWVLPLTLLWLAGEGLIRFVLNPLRLFRAVRRGGHELFAGVSPLALRMAARWAAEGRPVVAVSASAVDCAALRGRGAAVIESAWGSAEVNARSGLARAGTVVIAAGTDLENIDQAAAAADAVSAGRAGDAPPLRILLQVNDPFLRARIDERIDRFGRLDAVQVRVTSVSQVAARRLLREHPLDRFRHAGRRAPVVWIAGLGRLGEEIAVSLLRQAHYRNGGKPGLVLVDRDGERARQAFVARWPGAATVGNLTFLSAEAATGERLVEQLGAADVESRPDAIYLCLPLAEENAALALALAAGLRKHACAVPPVYMRGRPVGGAGLSEGEWIHGFGDDDWLAEGVMQVEIGLDALARHIHERYLAEAVARGEVVGARRALRPWILLPEDLKDDNRNVADHHFVKIRDCGCRVVSAADSQAAFEFDAAEIESLAEAEHARWLAVREVNGWRHGETRDDAAKIHPDMVPYAALAESRKELDRAVVRGIPAALRETGLAIVRDLAVAVTGPRAQWAFTPAFESAVAAELAALAAAYPQQQLVLWFAPDSALACRVAELALDGGRARVSVMLTESPEALLDRQPDEATRQRVRRLLRAAERVVVAADAQQARGELRARCAMELALSIDGEGVQQTDAVLALDASGRVHHRPARLR